MSVFRANSLAAVTILVWSTRLKPSSAAHLRTAWRTRTTSVSDRAGRVSLFSTAIAVGPSLRPRRHAKQSHAALDVERRSHAGQGQAQFHEGDGHGRLHADDDGFRVQ